MRPGDVAPLHIVDGIARTRDFFRAGAVWIDRPDLSRRTHVQISDPLAAGRPGALHIRALVSDRRRATSREIVDCEVHYGVRHAILTHRVSRVDDLLRIGREVRQELERTVVRELAESRAVEVHDCDLKNRAGTRYDRATNRDHEDHLVKG